MDQVPADQQNIHGLKGVALPLDMVSHPPAQQQHQFIKFMVVVVQRKRPVIPQMEQPVGLVQISALADLTSVQHRFPPFKNEEPPAPHFYLLIP